MKTIKVRKIGNSIGMILPKESGLQAGDLLYYSQDDGQIILDTKDVQKNHDRHLVEESFADFAVKDALTEADMMQKFGQYGWGDTQDDPDNL